MKATVPHRLDYLGLGSSWRGSREEIAQGRVWERVRKVGLMGRGWYTALPMEAISDMCNFWAQTVKM